MSKLLSSLICLAICACGQSPVAKTAAITNGEHVLGIVPLQNGSTAKDQRYRLLVCKKLPEYSAATFADQNVCRSALLTEDGREVDFVGSKLDAAHKDVTHLESEFASEARELGQSPLDEADGVGERVKMNGILGALLIGYGVLETALSISFSISSGHISELSILLGATGIVLGTYMVVVAVRKGGRLTKRNERRKRSGDDAGRAYPKAIKTGFFTHQFSPTAIVTHQYWHDVTSVTSFRNVTSLEDDDNLRVILKAMARFYKLKVKVNADALAL